MYLFQKLIQEIKTTDIIYVFCTKFVTSEFLEVSAKLQDHQRCIPLPGNWRMHRSIRISRYIKINFPNLKVNNINDLTVCKVLMGQGLSVSLNIYCTISIVTGMNDKLTIQIPTV